MNGHGVARRLRNNGNDLLRSEEFRAKERAILSGMHIFSAQEKDVRNYEEHFNGPDPSCWEDERYTYKRCCGSLYSYKDPQKLFLNRLCWTDDYTPQRCCGDSLYYPQTCLDFVKFFDFSAINVP